MARLTRTFFWPTASAQRAERDWQHLCDAYLPIQRKNSIWRYSRKRNRNDPSQGWKLHVSGTILSARSIFRSIAPYLSQRSILFKAPNSLAELKKLNSGIFYGFSQVGKFITVYPPSVEEAVVIADKLNCLTATQPAPIVPYDNVLQNGSCVHYRYGTFSRRRKMTFRGNRVLAIARTDGKLVPDRQEPRTAVPPWLKDPFQRLRTRREAVTPLETTYRDYEALVQEDAEVFIALSISHWLNSILVFSRKEDGMEKQTGMVAMASTGFNAKHGFYEPFPTVLKQCPD